MDRASSLKAESANDAKTCADRLRWLAPGLPPTDEFNLSYTMGAKMLGEAKMIRLAAAVRRYKLNAIICAIMVVQCVCLPLVATEALPGFAGVLLLIVDIPCFLVLGAGVDARVSRVQLSTFDLWYAALASTAGLIAQGFLFDGDIRVVNAFHGWLLAVAVPAGLDSCVFVDLRLATVGYCSGALYVLTMVVVMLFGRVRIVNPSVSIDVPGAVLQLRTTALTAFTTTKGTATAFYCSWAYTALKDNFWMNRHRRDGASMEGSYVTMAGQVPLLRRYEPESLTVNSHT